MAVSCLSLAYAINVSLNTQYLFAVERHEWVNIHILIVLAVCLTCSGGASINAQTGWHSM